MENCTAVIDIGSNSARLVIYQESSRYGFHLVCERKSKVRIGEGAYEAGGSLQPIGIHRAYLALKEFINTTKNYPVTRTFCVATSALRDAPNGVAFTQWIKKHLDLDIEIIDGTKEAMFGAIAALNLLPIQEGITVDIGGGSSDLALIKNSKIVQTYSLNIGTVRLKELFFDKNIPLADARNFIQKELKKLPKEFQHKLAIGIGGTARTLSKGIMQSINYPLENIHAFSYRLKEHTPYFSNISEANLNLLTYLYLPKGRFDTIREGTLIWQEILTHLGTQKVITSGVGVREGVFLHHFLINSHSTFPKHINPSIQSILDRFQTPHINTEKRKICATKLFNLFTKKQHIPKKYLKELLYAIELSPIGYRFNIYQSSQHAFYVAMQEFNYGITHKELVLTAMLLRFEGKQLYLQEIYTQYANLLPKKKHLEILSFIYTLVMKLYDNTAIKHFDFTLDKNILTIKAEDSLYLVEEKLQGLESPLNIEIETIDKREIPYYAF
jgi:exopolyphosphatase/guanosine-5'-triphosphate,3'-diphosphate pyrophosphatase